MQNNVEYLLENGVDFHNRIIYITDHLTCEDSSSLNYNNIIKSLFYFSTNNPTKKIKIIINSFGGDVYEALSIVDIISLIPNKTIGIGAGLVASGASLILASCKERYLTENSFIMMHELSSSIEGKHTDQKIEVVHQDNILDNMCNIYSKIIKDINFPRIKEMLKKDYYLSPKEALKIKFIKDILNNKKFKKIIKE